LIKKFMINPFKKNAKLVLSNGTIFPGFSFGASGTAVGEIVFNTGMTGYQEVITDPSYYGQILTFTYPEIGNTGINLEDSESSISVKGIIVRNYSSNESNWRSLTNFNEWLVEKNIIGLYGIDTRALVKILRSNGSMNGVLTSENNTVESCLNRIYETPKMEGLNLSKIVSTKQQYLWENPSETDFDVRLKNVNQTNKLKIVAIDFGIKKSILNRLVSHGCEILVLPSRSSLKDVLSNDPDGIFFSNGPGDPSTVTEGIDLARSLIEIGNIPMFGICLGHQIFGLALGGSTYKLPFGHRGLNHPCGINNQVEITSQNHGFAIDPNSLSKDKVKITHYNLNDNTVAGLEVKNKPIFSVQYHPEAGPGPHDSDYLFKKFVSLMLERC
jgi:carbamoyl-phosphate synthase small subunit